MFTLVKQLIKLAFYVVFTPFVLLGTLVTAPIWYPKNKRKRRDRRLLLLSLLTRGRAALCHSTAEGNRETGALKRLANLSEAQFEVFLLQTLESMQGEDGWFYLRIDWAATDEVEPQTDALAKQLGLEGRFVPKTLSDDPASIETALAEFGGWLGQRGYRLVLWEQGGDEYIGFACQQQQLDDLLSCGDALCLSFQSCQ
ncbi:DUF6630 family protein [Ferrimonas kyonanensis]|uniref:DUF6630 family protein n=1 Tax=Ferrimonas kyonanensis TaxID=364763 RepID=UPI00041E3054|nr:hypothetical protein [Ferrimonas kyonanensis]